MVLFLFPLHPHVPTDARDFRNTWGEEKRGEGGEGDEVEEKSKWIGRIPNVAPSTYRKLLELRQDFGSSFQILLKPFKILDRRVSPLSIMLCTRHVGNITVYRCKYLRENICLPPPTLSSHLPPFSCIYREMRVHARMRSYI